MNKLVSADPIDSIKELAVHAAIEFRYLERQQTRDSVLYELTISLLKNRPWLIQGLEFSWESYEIAAKAIAGNEKIWEAIDDLVGRADSSLSRLPDDGKNLSRWRCPPVQTLSGKRDAEHGANMEALSDCSYAYLGSGWAHSPTLELWLTRQMIFAESFAFSRQVGIPLIPYSSKFWWLWTKNSIKWVIGLLVAIAIGTDHGTAIGVFAYVVWLALVRYLADDQVSAFAKIERTASAMRQAYMVAGRAKPSPIEIRNALLRAEETMAIWPEGVWSLVERTISRSRVEWV